MALKVDGKSLLLKLKLILEVSVLKYFYNSCIELELEIESSI